MDGLHIDVLGDLEVRAVSGPILVRGRKQRLLLATLALHSRRVLAVDELVDMLWEESPPTSARTTLRGYVKRLRDLFRRADGPGYPVIESVDGGYRLVVEREYIDLHRFRALRTAAEQCADGQQESTLLGNALSLWRGRPLSGLGGGRWLAETATGIEEELLQVAERRCELQLEFGGPAAEAIEMRRLLVRHPYRESLWRLLILGLHRAGRTAEALSEYERVRRLLADQLGVAPSGQLRSLHQRMLREDGEPDRRPAEFSPPRREWMVPGFVGRRQELAALDALHSRAISTVVIDGGAGTGKTALARRWAELGAHRFPDGLIYLNLRGFHPDAPLRPHTALSDLLRAMGMADVDIPAGLPARHALYQSLVHERRMLVLLDNVRDRRQVEPLLPGGANLTMLTSRRQLRGLVATTGAARVTVRGLAPRDAASIVTASLPRPAGPDAEDRIHELARLCSGLPLALRVVAEQLTRVPGLTLEDLVRELSDHRNLLDVLETGDDPTASVREVLRRSLHALTGPERLLLRRLACHLQAEFELCDAVAVAGIDSAEVRSMLDTFVELNIVDQVGPRRFRVQPLQQAVARE